MSTHSSPSENLSHVDKIIAKLKYYLPSQAPLKDFIHHNTLHAFQHDLFHDGILKSQKIFGTKVYLTLDEYRKLYQQKQISHEMLVKEVAKAGITDPNFVEKVLTHPYSMQIKSRAGELKKSWNSHYHLEMDLYTHPTLFRFLCNYLDQGVSLWPFPQRHMGFVEAVRHLDNNPWVSVFMSKNSRVRTLLKNPKTTIESLLEILVGDEKLYETYLFDQQFGHSGWSGIASTIEDQPLSLIDTRHITLKDVIFFELLLEIDFLDFHLGNSWKPIKDICQNPQVDLFAPVYTDEQDMVIRILQNAFEATYYHQVLSGLVAPRPNTSPTKIDFQAIFCIDDRECSFRRYLEMTHPQCETFGTPGFFGVEFFFQPENSKFYTKLCPAPVTPKYLIKEQKSKQVIDADFHFHQSTHSFVKGWFVTQTLGYWSAIKLFWSIFRPSITPATASALRHMDKQAELTIENTHVHNHEHHLQIGFTEDEMTERVYNMLMSIGLVKNFAPLIYLVGHGASSVNNPHYSAYDCGACSGRPGSVNARVFAHMANHPQVRKNLADRGISIPRGTRFVGALHDTTRDEVDFYDELHIPMETSKIHQVAVKVFEKSLQLNAKERSRRFEIVNTQDKEETVRDKVRLRSVSLFEPRPELNHATNALCIIGPRQLTRGLFLDRRSFLNSYDYSVDPEGEILTRILNAAAPVCGGINLEYYFSRVDNQKLGAGTKLPHNVMGLIGVANGIEGDLRPGLPSQMIEVHDPVRLLIIAEHTKDVALKAIQRNPVTYEWFINEWVHFVSIDPHDKKLFLFSKGEMVPYKTSEPSAEFHADIFKLIEHNSENIPVTLFQGSQQ